MQWEVTEQNFYSNYVWQITWSKPILNSGANSNNNLGLPLKSIPDDINVEWLESKLTTASAAQQPTSLLFMAYTFKLLVWLENRKSLENQIEIWIGSNRT